MFESLVRLAVGKASSPPERDALQPVLAAAVALDDEERTFGDRIDASKALRGESPTRLPKRRQAEIDEFAADAERLQAQQLREFAGFDSAAAILSCLQTGLRTDVAFWASASRKAHPADAALVSAFHAAKLRLSEAIGTYLAWSGHDED